LPTRADVEAYAAQVFALIDRLLTELGGSARQAELAQEQAFAQHLATLPDGVTAVFEEHPGMFRARRFGTLAPMPKPGKTEAGAASKSGMNSVRAYQQAQQQALFQRALEERGELLKRFKGG